MKIGLDLIRSKSTKATLRKMWQRLGKKISGTDHVHEHGTPPPPAYDHNTVNVLDPGLIKRLIADPAITVVSFDIFDSLLVRPALQPKDIFYVVAKKVDKTYGVEFIKLRWDAEERLGKPNATIREIYDHIAAVHGLSPHIATALMEEEIRCERTLLSPRPDIQEIHAEAARLGKRIIAVSDMYLPADVLDDFLKKKGCPVSAVYVSCEHGTRKSDGGLYDAVIASEDVYPSEILHIGDNYQSDYVKALEKKITAVHYPAVHAMCFGEGAPIPSLFAEAARKDPVWSLLLGFSLNRLYGKYADAPTHIFDLRDMRHFAELVVAPLVTGFCLSLAARANMQERYNAVYFASRDGYLPHKIYSIVAKHVDCIPGFYFYAGRRAYYPYLYDSFFDHVDSLCRVSNPLGYTLGDLLKVHFDGTDLMNTMETALSEKEKKLSFLGEKKECITVLNRFRADIEACMREKRARITRYYDTVFAGGKERLLVFDLGYSGSIGKALSAITGKKIDKIYFWEELENRNVDKAQGSTTWVFMKNQTYGPYYLPFEELFSPCEGGVTGFTEHTQPIFEDITFSEGHKASITAVHECCQSFAEAFCEQLGEYAPHTCLQEPDVAVDMCQVLLEEAPFCNMRLFKDIVFPDPVCYGAAVSLEKKMESGIPRATVFSGTGFENPHSSFSLSPRLNPGHGRIGIHAHVYNMALSHEMLCYFQDFPAPFDLFVTIVDAAFTRTAQNLFNTAVIPNAQSVTVLPVPNRGRDVAPWLLGMRPYQASYDLFCHIHSKESPHIGCGDQWRKYFFDNLIKSDTATEILNIFTEHPQVGCLFPAIHPKVRNVMTNVGVPLYGSEHEYALICGLLHKMGIQEELRRTELFFSVGTMFWYRPQALRQLFTIDLCLEDFAEEPIGLDGTLAHAIERLPALLAERNGYAAKNYTKYT